MARRKRSSSAKSRMAYVRSFRKGAKKAAPKRKRARRRTQSNPYPMAGLVVNPRRRRRKASPARRARRRSFQRNPKLLGISLPPLNKVLFAGVGFVAPPMLEGLLSQFIPAELQSSVVGKYAIRIASVLGLTYLVRRFVGKSEGDMALIGGGVYVASTAAMEFAPSIFGAHPPVLPTVNPSGVSGYISGGALAGYVPGTGRVNTGLGLPPVRSGIQGQAARFNRFNR